MIDLTVNKEALERNIQKARENRIVIPTYRQMKDPETIPGKIKDKLAKTGLWDVDPVNLFRITWKNEARESGGLYQAVPNYVELPPDDKIHISDYNCICKPGKEANQRHEKECLFPRPLGGCGA